jgi:hypothetical protein
MVQLSVLFVLFIASGDLVDLIIDHVDEDTGRRLVPRFFKSEMIHLHHSANWNSSSFYLCC